MRRFILIFLLFPLVVHSEIYLRENLKSTEKGDYLVTQQNKNYTVMIVKDRLDDIITIEEVTVPGSRKPKGLSWKAWIEKSAPGHTCWVVYTVNVNTGKMLSYSNYREGVWYDMSGADIFLSKLLALKLELVPPQKRRKWNPTLIYEGKEIKQVSFDEYEASWPKDGSEMAGKIITIYLPEKSSNYPFYFPYWLQVRGLMGGAKVRVVDSGKNMRITHE